MRFLLFLSVLLAGCSTPFEVEIPSEDPRLVVTSLFAADSAFTLNVRESEPLLQDAPPGVGNVTTATVTIFEDGVEVGRAPYVQSRLRYVSDIRPRAGRTYRVRVEAPGFETAEAEDTVPLPRPFAATVTRGPEPTGGRDRLDDVTLRFADPAGPDYYAVYGLAERRFPNRPDATQFFPLLFQSADPVLADGDLEALISESDPPFYLRAFFSDRPFDGAEVAVQIQARRDRNGTDGGVEVTDRLRLATLSETYYRYQRARAQGGTPFDDAVRVPSNVRGGYGIVAAFNATEHVLPTP